MSKAYVEIDFFQMEKRNSASSKPCSPERAPSSVRGIQSVVSRINPQLLKTVMAAEHARSSDSVAARQTPSNPPPPSRTTSPPPLPVFNPSSRGSSPPTTDTAPLTIFYNGTVATFDVPRDKAEAIMRMVETGAVGMPVRKPEDSLLEGSSQLEGDMPIARNKSLRRFLEKRKERLAWASPYHKVIPSGLR